MNKFKKGDRVRVMSHDFMEHKWPRYKDSIGRILTVDEDSIDTEEQYNDEPTYLLSHNKYSVNFVESCLRMAEIKSWKAELK